MRALYAQRHVFCTFSLSMTAIKNGIIKLEENLITFIKYQLYLT